MNRRRGFVEDRNNIAILKFECVESVQMDSVKGASGCFLMHLKDEAQIIDSWLLSHKCSEWWREKILSAFRDINFL